MQKAIILEIDGILSDDSHRRHFIIPPEKHILWESQQAEFFIEKDPYLYDGTVKLWHPDYEAYHGACDKDGVNEWCADLIESWQCGHDDHTEIILVTNRSEKYRIETVNWIFENNSGISPDFYKLFMRPDFLPCIEANFFTNGKCLHDIYERKPDNRPSHEVKREIYESEIKDKYNVLFVLERSGPDAEMYRELGLTVLTC